ncbi:hypothetical protein CLOM_g15983 [Closterium sp. NIES-68]|nr:hypothetical protein CLOM_g15983 [Closterium sp. NIES-68]
MTPRADLLDEVEGANGELVGLGNVLLVEGLSANLLSVRRLQKSKAEVTFGPTSCRAKLGKKVLWSLEEETSCIKDLWQLPIIPWNGKTPTAATAAAAKATAGGDANAPTDGVLEAVKKVQQQQTHGEKLVKDRSLKGLEVKGGVKEIGSCPTCLETKFSKFPFNSTTGLAKTPLALSKGEVAAAVLKEWMPRAQRECGHKVKQTKGKDYDEVFAPVGKGTTLRVLLAIAALLGWKIRQMDIVTAFLNGIILEEVYMKQPEGLDDGSGRVCRLKKAIYGLKQAPRAWYHKLEEALLAGGLKKMKADGTSIGGYVCLLGGGAVSWRSKKQNEVGLSSCETEYL